MPRPRKNTDEDTDADNLEDSAADNPATDTADKEPAQDPNLGVADPVWLAWKARQKS